MNRPPIGSVTYFAPDVIRTHNLLIRSQMLFPDSVTGANSIGGEVRVDALSRTALGWDRDLSRGHFDLVGHDKSFFAD
jgi:hypothetical protein